MLRFYRLYKFIRNNSNPIPENVAEKWQKRLRFISNFFAWNAFGVVVYACYNGKIDWAAYHGLKTEEETKVSPGILKKQSLGLKNAEVYRVSGFSLIKVDETTSEENNSEVSSQ